MEVEKKKIVSYKDLEVWKKGVRFTIEIYRITSEFPSREQFGLTNQLRRAASSIPANIAEGYGRESTKNYIQFLKTARGSLNEVETFLYIGFELEYLNKQTLDNLIIKTTELGKMMNSLIKKLNPNPTA
jgi:four helix bundle protein